jgi:hypothetical protein
MGIIAERLMLIEYIMPSTGLLALTGTVLEVSTGKNPAETGGYVLEAVICVRYSLNTLI